MNIPTELTEFIPEKVEMGMFASWDFKTDEFSETVEIHNALFSRQTMKATIAITAWMAFILGICIACILMFDGPKLFDKMPDWLYTTFLIVFFSFAALGTVGIWVGMMLYQASCNASLWKEKIRFQYNKSSGELFFPRENARYSRNDYDTLILGVTDGYNTVKLLEKWKEYKENGGRHGSLLEAELAMQLYFLVRQKDGAWHRHLVAYDRRSKTIHRIVAKIQKAMRCRVAKRSMSLQESYATQHKHATTEAQPEMPGDCSYAVVGISLLFMLIGIITIGFGLHGLWNSDDNAVGIIFFGIGFFLIPLICLLAFRYSAKQNNLSAPYTPSEAVLS